MASIEKGNNGQWIITAEYCGWFHSKQYYGYTKVEAMAKAKQELKDHTFFNDCHV